MADIPSKDESNGTDSWTANGIVLQEGVNVITVTARDATENLATDTVTVTCDPTSPSVAVSTPTSDLTYSTSSSSLDIYGTASDNVAVTEVSWSNDRGGSGTCTGTDSWTGYRIVLQESANIITVTARDAAGNAATDTLTVTYDPTSPTVEISTPTSDPNYFTSSSSLDIGGTASDNVGVSEVSWSSDRGGSGTCIGTDTWTVTGITLQEGVNVITVTAKDAAGNAGTDTLTVTYDPISPSVAISTPTSDLTYSTSSSSLDIYGTASDNVAADGGILVKRPWRQWNLHWN